MATRWGGLRPEPYDPDAVDADGDGIVQEGTAFERPGGTRLVDQLGNALTRGLNITERDSRWSVVDRNGTTVPYTPTYARDGGTATPATPGAGTPLADHGARSLRELGLPTIQTLASPAPTAALTPTPSAATPDSPQLDTPPKMAIAVPELAEFNGERAQVNGWGNARFNEWKRQADAAYGGTVRGEPISPDDPLVPDFVYHVTPAFTALQQSGRILAGGKGGLGGDDRDRIVSMTTNEDVARGILTDMRLVRDVASRNLDGQQLLDYLREIAVDEGTTLRDSVWDSIDHAIKTNGPAQGLSAYLVSRDIAGGRRDPLFVGLGDLLDSWKTAPPADADLQIARIPKKNLKTGAQLTNFDVGQGYLDEIRLYGDVPMTDVEALSDSPEVKAEPLPEDLSDWLVENLNWAAFGIDPDNVDDEDLYNVGDRVVTDWGHWQPCRDMRRAAFELVGLDGDTPEVDPNINRSGGYFGSSIGISEAEAEASAQYLMMSLAVIHERGYVPDTSLYRAMDLRNDEAAAFWAAMTPGQDVDIPLLAFADRRDQGGNEYLTKFGSQILIEVEPGASFIEGGHFEPMYDDSAEADTLGTLDAILDEIAADEDMFDFQDEQAEFVTNVRDLLDSYAQVSRTNRDEREALRREIRLMMEDYVGEMSWRWAGESIDEADTDYFYDAVDNNTPELVPEERISGGRFRVVAVDDDPRGVYQRRIVLRQDAVFDPRSPGALVQRTKGSR